MTEQQRRESLLRYRQWQAKQSLGAKSVTAVNSSFKLNTEVSCLDLWKARRLT